MDQSLQKAPESREELRARLLAHALQQQSLYAGQGCHSLYRKIYVQKYVVGRLQSISTRDSPDHLQMYLDEAIFTEADFDLRVLYGPHSC